MATLVNMIASTPVNSARFEDELIGSSLGLRHSRISDSGEYALAQLRNCCDQPREDLTGRTMQAEVADRGDL